MIFLECYTKIRSQTSPGKTEVNCYKNYISYEVDKIQEKKKYNTRKEISLFESFIFN